MAGRRRKEFIMSSYLWLCGAGLIFGVAFMIAFWRWITSGDKNDRELFREWRAEKEKGDE